MTITPVDPATIVDLRDDLSLTKAWARLRQAQATLEQAQREVDLYRGRFDELIGEREQITADGRAVAFYRHDGRFSAKRFTEEMPHIASGYIRQRVEEYIDEEALNADHPFLYKQYRARTLRPAKGA